jgi:hypothetical protein
MFGVLFRRVVVMLAGVERVPVRHFGMVGRFLVIAGLGVPCRLAMVLGGMLVVVRGLLVMLVNLMIVHRFLPDRFVGMAKHRRER